MRNSPQPFPEATKSLLMSLVTAKADTPASKATTRSAAPPLLRSHARTVSPFPLASRISPVAGSAKAVSALTQFVCSQSTRSAAPPTARSHTRTEPSLEPLALFTAVTVEGEAATPTRNVVSLVED